MGWAVFAVLTGLLLGQLYPALAIPVSNANLDKAKLAEYIRYADGFMPEVQIRVDDPQPSPFTGFKRVLVHLTVQRGSATQKADRVYYVTIDGQQIVPGTVWQLNDSPFRDTLNHLPRTGPAFGPADAKVTIVVFSDFECPYCREMAKTIRDNISKSYPRDVKVLFEDYPLRSEHKWAASAAEAAHCITRQKESVFWDFHDWIFEHQGEVNEQNLRSKVLEFAGNHQLDAAILGTCLDQHRTAAEVDQSERSGRALQITQTPTLFINGRMVPGAVSWKNLESIIEIELHRPNKIRSATTEGCCEVSIPSAMQTDKVHSGAVASQH